MNKESKNHHFIPRSILRNFSYDENEHIWVFDKWNGRSFTQTVEKSGSENKYNTVKMAGMIANFETIYDEYDSKLASIIHTITSTNSISSLSSNDIDFIYIIFIIQILRSPIVRSTYIDVSYQMKKIVSEAFPNVKNEADYDINEETAKILSIKSILSDNSELIEVIKKKPIVLQYSPKSEIIISDNPIVLYSHSPYELYSLSSKYTEIDFPISPNIALTLIPEVVLEALPHITSKSQHGFELMKSLQEKCPLTITKEAVLFLNSLQINRSKRFIYSSYEVVPLVKSILRKHPNLKKRISTITVGKFSKNKSVPLYKHLVINDGQFYNTIPILDYSTNDDKIIVVCNAKYKSKIIFNQNIPSISIYEEQIECITSRHIKINLTDETKNRLKLIIQHYDFQFRKT